MKTIQFLRPLFAILLTVTLVLGGSMSVFAEEDTQQPAIREVGEPASVNVSDENTTISIEYPVLGNEAIDGQIEAWAQQQAVDFAGEIASLKDESEAIEGELTVGYEAYAVSERYVGLAETGMLSHSLLAHPADIAQTFNIDLTEGRLLSIEDILPEAGRNQVYELLNAAIEKIDETAGPADETWLEHIVLTGDGLVVITPRGEHFASALGMQRITLSYGELGESLGITIDE